MQAAFALAQRLRADASLGQTLQVKSRERSAAVGPGRWGRRWLSGGLALLASSATPRAAAAAASALVEWEAPEACPGAAAVFERLSESLGYEPQELGKLSRVRGNVVPSARGYRLSLEVYENGRRSSRWLEAPSCEDLVDAAVLAITLALAPENAPAAASEGSHAPAPQATDAAAISADSAPLAEPLAMADAAAPVRGVAALGVVAEQGALPGFALGVSFSAGAHWTRWSAELYGMLFGGQRLAARPGQYIDFELNVAGLRGCQRWPGRTLVLAACTGIEAGRWEAFGADLAGARRSRDLWLAPAAALAAGLTLTGALALELRAEGAVPLARKRYVINDDEGVHTPDAVSWRLTLGLSIGSRGR